MNPGISDINDFIVNIIATECKQPKEHINIDDSFFSLGLDSISAVYLMELVEKKFKVELSPLYFWDYPSIRSLSGQIFKENFES